MPGTTRREFIALIGGGCLLLAVKVKRAWGQQQPKMLRVGFVGMQPREAPHYPNFLMRMAEYQKAGILHSTTSKHRTSKATTETIASSQRAKLMCSWQSGVSRRYVRRFPPRTVSRSRSW